MSAFVVSKKHIDAIIASVLVADRLHFILDHERTNETGQMLWAENFRSVTHRYNRAAGDAPPEYRFPIDTRPLPPVAALKALDCLEYQSCECSDWTETAAHEWITRARSVLIAALPGYEEAAWCVD